MRKYILLAIAACVIGASSFAYADTVSYRPDGIYLVRTDGKSAEKAVLLVPGSLAYAFIKEKYPDGSTIPRSDASKLLDGTNNTVPSVVVNPPVVVQPPVVTDPPVVVENPPVVTNPPVIEQPPILATGDTLTPVTDTALNQDVLDPEIVFEPREIVLEKDYGIACAQFTGVSAGQPIDEAQAAQGQIAAEEPCTEAP